MMANGDDDEDEDWVPTMFDVGGQDCDSIYTCPYRWDENCII